MANWLTYFLCGTSVAITFAITTVLAHRTHPHARHERVLGLGLAIALVTLCTWMGTSLLDSLSALEKSLCALGVALLCVFYSYIVLESRSILRYAGVGIAIILWFVALALDAFGSSNYLPWASSLAAIAASINFLGHLLRARVNKALLRAPKEARLRAPNVKALEMNYHCVRLFLDHPSLISSSDGQKVLEGICISSHDLSSLVERLLQDFAKPSTLKTVNSTGTCEKNYHLSALLPLISIWARVFNETRPVIKTYNCRFIFDSENMWLDVDGEIKENTSFDARALKKFIYDHSADLVDVELKNKQLHVHIGYRLPY